MSRQSCLGALALGCLLLSSFVFGAYAFSNGENASVVIGQPNFTSRASASTQSGLAFPEGVAFDSSGNLWVADTDNSRVLEFLKGSGFSDGEAASVVIGQPNFSGNASAATGSGLAYPTDITFDHSGDLWVADQGNNRVLEFTPPFTDGESASLVIGQPNLTASGNATTQSGLYVPSALAFDSAGDLWVVDQGNNRVLEFAPPFSDGEKASLVIGQANFTSSQAGFERNGLIYPSMLAFDPAGNLWVSDTFNSTVLEYARPFTNGEAASAVIGGLSLTLTATPNTLSEPVGLAFDSSGDLWVGDSLDGRVVEFAPPFVANESASLVVGKPDFTSGGPASITPTTQSGLRFPHGIALDSSGNVWVADSHNNRVVEFPATGASTSTSSTTSGPTLTYDMQVNIKYDQVQSQYGEVNGSTLFNMAITLNETGPTELGFPIFPTEPPGTLVGLGGGNGTFTATVDSCQQAPATGNYAAYIVANASLSSGQADFYFFADSNNDIGECANAANYNAVDNLIESCFSTLPNSTNGACSSFPISGGTKAISMGPDATIGTNPFKSVSGSVTLTLVNSSSTYAAPEFPTAALAAIALTAVAAVAVVSSRARKAGPP